MWWSFNKTLFIKTDGWDFTGGPVVKTSTAGTVGLIPGQGTKVPRAAMLPKEKNKNQMTSHFWPKGHSLQTPTLYVISGKEQEQPVLGSNATLVPYKLYPPDDTDVFSFSKNNFFFNFWLCHTRPLIVVCRLLSLVVVHGLQSSWALYFQHMGSLVGAIGLNCSMACGILVPWPRIKPESPTLEGRFLTTGPQGKSWLYHLFEL